jgi:hypothetical protein
MNTPTDTIIGQKFWFFTVIGKTETNNGGYCWICRCECGEIRNVNRWILENGKHKSCGCMKARMISKAKRKHGGTARLINGKRQPEYKAWCRIRTRCYSESDPDYKNYGGRGIVVCDRWNESFADFLHDMGPRPSDQHASGRKDNNGPYSPDNCSWETRIQQNNNKRDNRRIEFDGQSLTLAEWSRKTGFTLKQIWSRINRGWSAQQTLTTPIQNAISLYLPSPCRTLPSSPAAASAEVAELIVPAE